VDVAVNWKLDEPPGAGPGVTGLVVNGREIETPAGRSAGFMARVTSDGVPSSKVTLRGIVAVVPRTRVTTRLGVEISTLELVWNRVLPVSVVSTLLSGAGLPNESTLADAPKVGAPRLRSRLAITSR
jgi:hypothetical protein